MFKMRSNWANVALVLTLCALVVPRCAMGQTAAMPHERQKQSNVMTGIRAIDAAESAAESKTPLVLKNTVELTAEARIEQALDRSASIQLAETPLKDFAERLRSEYGIPVTLDVKSLTDAGGTVDMPFTGTYSDISLRSILDMALREHELDWVLDDESLLIMSKAKAREAIETRIYPVFDLVLVRYADGIDEDYDSLIELITSTIDTTSWVDAGGVGAIGPFENSGAIVVSQTRGTHEQIELLLDSLRTAHDVQRIPTIETAVPPKRDLAPSFGAAVGSQQHSPTAVFGGGGAFQVVDPDNRVQTRQPADAALLRPAWQVPQVYK